MYISPRKAAQAATGANRVEFRIEPFLLLSVAAGQPLAWNERLFSKCLAGPRPSCVVGGDEGERAPKRRTREPESRADLANNLLASCLLSRCLWGLGQESWSRGALAALPAQPGPWGLRAKAQPWGSRSQGVKTPGSPGQESEIRYSGRLSLGLEECTARTPWVSLQAFPLRSASCPCRAGAGSAIRSGIVFTGS